MARAPEPSLRVLQVIDSLVPAGAESSLAAQAPLMRDLGVDLTVAYLVERNGLRDALIAAGVDVIDAGQGTRSRVRHVEGIDAVIHHTQPHLVHTTLFEADIAGRIAAARRGITCVSTWANTGYGEIEIAYSGNSRLKVRAAQGLDALTSRTVARFQAVTPHVAEVMRRRLVVPASRVEVIPRGRDRRQLGYPSASRRGLARQRLGVGPQTPLILAVARHEPQKGLDLLISAMPEIRKHVPGATTVIAGREGRTTQALTRLRHGLLDPACVKLLGARSDIPELMCAADAFVLPSHWEGAAGSLIEAMALECPVVTTDLATLRGTVDSRSAVLVQPGSVENIAAGVIQTLQHKTATKERARIARELFETQFTIETAAARLAAFYRSALASRRGRW